MLLEDVGEDLDPVRILCNHFLEFMKKFILIF